MKAFHFLLLCGLASTVSFSQSHSELEKRIVTLEEAMWTDYKQGLLELTALEATVEASDCLVCKAQFARLMGKFLWADGEYNRGLSFFRRAIRFSEQADDHQTKASSLDLIGNTFYYQAYYDSGIHYFNKALQVYKETENIQGQISVLHNISLMYHRKGDFNKTIEFLFKEEELKDQLPGSVYEIEAMGAMGSLMVDSIYYLEEIRDELSALKNYQQKNDKRGMLRTYRNIGKSYRQLEEYQLAARYFVKACLLQESLGLVPEWDLAGTDYRDADRSDSSFYYHYKAAKEFPRMTKPNIAYTLELIGDAHRHFRNYDSALLYYDSAFRMNVRMNNRITFTGIHRYLVNVYTNLRNYERAEYHLLKGLNLAKEVALIHEKNLYLEGKLLYESKGDYRQALWYSEQYRVFQDSTNRTETALNLTRMQAEFKTAKKTREVEALQQKNMLNETQLEMRNLQIALTLLVVLLVASLGVLYYLRYRQKTRVNAQLERQSFVIEKQNKELEIQNKTKEVLLAEIHHRVKNNLQIISSLINLKSRHSGMDTKEILSQLNGRIFSMGLLHEKLYKNENIQSVRLDLYLAELIHYLLDSFLQTNSSVTLELNLDETEIHADNALTCGLICNELFTNTIKYAFTEDQSSKIVRISLRKNEDHLEFKTSDNGMRMKSLPEDMKQSFGLRFVDQLVTSKLGGTWSYVLDGGFRTEIRIPVGSNGKN